MKLGEWMRRPLVFGGTDPGPGSVFNRLATPKIAYSSVTFFQYEVLNFKFWGHGGRGYAL